MPKDPACADVTADNRRAEDNENGRLPRLFLAFRVWALNRDFKVLRA